MEPPRRLHPAATARRYNVRNGLILAKQGPAAAGRRRRDRRCSRSCPKPCPPADGGLREKGGKTVFGIQSSLSERAAGAAKPVAQVIEVIGLVEALRKSFEKAVIGLHIAPLQRIKEDTNRPPGFKTRAISALTLRRTPFGSS
jgi:hypothetical protein